MPLEPLLTLFAEYNQAIWPVLPLACLAAIALLALVVLARPPLPKHLLVIPFAWAPVATPAAVGRGVLEDITLLTAAALCGVVVVVRDRRHTASPTPLTANASPQAAGAGS